MKKFYRLGLIGCLIGIGLRVIFMLISLHADLLWIHVFPPKLAYEGVIDIYKYYITNFSTLASSINAGYYGPLTYFLLGGFHFVYKFLFPSLGSWLNDYLKILVTFDPSGYLNLFSSFHKSAIFLFLLKLPYLVFDVLTLSLLVSFLKGTRGCSAIRVASFWLLNPVILFGSYIFGQIDIFITFFLMLSLLAFKFSKLYLSILCIGLAAMFKPAPLVLILPASIIAGRNMKQMARLFFTGFSPMIISITFFYLSGGPTILMSMFPKFIVSKGANHLDTIEFLFGKIIFSVGFVFLLWKIIKMKRSNVILGAREFWSLTTVYLLLSYSVVFTPVHYFQWVVPFLIIGVFYKQIPFKIYILQMIFLFLYAINSRPLSMQLFLPLNPVTFYNMQSFPEFMSHFFNWGIVMRISRWAFYFCSFFMIYKLIFKMEEKSV